MDEAGPQAGYRVVQLGSPDAPTDALLNSSRPRLSLQFDPLIPSPNSEGNQP
jgi:hypothetical protein